MATAPGPGTGPYRPDQRDATAIGAAIAGSAAAHEPVPGLPHDPGTDPPTWADLLFAGDAPADPAEPSSALLAVTAELAAGLGDHLATLPGRARIAWLADTLAIPRRPMVPDEVVAVATLTPPAADAARAGAPPVLPAGTELRGGRTAAGTERTYLTTDTLTAHGASVLAVLGDHAEGIADRAAGWAPAGAGAAPSFAPFAGPPAEHVLDIVTDTVAFTGGTATATVIFPGRDATRLAGVRWQWSTPEGLVDVAPGGVAYTGNSVRLTLTGGCGPMEVDGETRTFLRAWFPGDDVPAGAYDFEFGEIRVVLERSGVAPQAGFHKQGALDVTAEFQPFGPTPRRGDTFALRCDEAFGKPLASLTLTLTLVDEASQSMLAVDYAAPYQQWFGDWLIAQDVTITAFPYSPPDPAILWQRWTAGEWSTFHTAGGDLHGTRTATAGTGTAPLSEPTEIAGAVGRFVRLQLSNGDFGWEDYLARVAGFAEAVATGGDPRAGDLIPPTPPTVSRVTIGYRTGQVPVRDLRTRNGHAARRITRPGPVHRAYRQQVPPGPGDAAGAVSIGFALPAARPGAALSVYARIDQAPACAAAGRDHDAGWEYWAQAEAWRPLAVVDGTRGLRQSGLVRFVMPPDWRPGCADAGDAGAGTGAHWVRLRTGTPAFVGTLLALHPDAVPARYRGDLADPALDRTPLTPLAAGELKGLRQAVPGIAITNPDPGVPGRAYEEDAAYARRAAGLVRHRGRAVQPWDYETLVAEEFGEVATVRCLPHTGPDGCATPGSVGLVVVPHGTEAMPYPSVTLAEAITARLAPVLPGHATVTVLCPLYVPVRVHAEIVLAPGVAAAEAERAIGAALEARLHPSGRGAADFGRALYPSALVVFLEERPEVDHVEEFRLLPPHAGAARVSVDPCRGLVASAGDHELVLRERL